MNHLFLYCPNVHSLKDTCYSPTYGRVSIFQKVRDRKGQLETSLGESVWGLIYSTNSPTHMNSDIQTQKGKHSPHKEVYYKRISFREYREDKEVGESVKKDRGQRGGDGRAEKVNRAEDDSNPFDLLPDELLKMIIDHSLSGLSRGSFVTAFTRWNNVCSRFCRIVMPHQRSIPRLHLDGNICPGCNGVMSLMRKYNKGSSVVMELKDIMSSKKWTQA